MARTSNPQASTSRANVPAKVIDACQVTTSRSKRRRKVNHQQVAYLRDDGVILVQIERDTRDHTLSPTPAELKNLFDNTENLPLDIDFNECSVFPRPPAVELKVLKQYFDLLLDVLPRWRAVEFWADFISKESLMGRELPEAPLLETVVIHGLPEWDLPLACAVLSRCWKNAPRFRHYETRQHSEGSLPSGGPGNPLAHIPLTQMTTLRIDNQISAEQCVNILFYAPVLETCALTNITGPQVIPGVVEHQSLKSLKLVVNFEDHCKSRPTFLWCILDILKAPALQHLTIECDDKWKNDNFLNFIRASQCQLLVLEFDMVRLNGNELNTILMHTPKLRALKIHGDSSQSPQAVSPLILRALTNPSSQPMLCPELVAISLNDDALEDICGGSFSLMICSRLGETPLKVVWLAMSKENPDHQVDIQNLVQVRKDYPKLLHRAHVCEPNDGRRLWDEEHVPNILEATKDTTANRNSDLEDYDMEL